MLKKKNSKDNKNNSGVRTPRPSIHVRFAESVRFKSISIASNSAVTSEASYNPYNADRKVVYPTTNTETFFHLLKAALGTGVLAMPNAFLNAGWAVAIAGVPLIGIICTYCIHLLIKCQFEVARRQETALMDYPGTAVASLMEGPNCCKNLAPFCGLLVKFFLLLYQIGTCCVYFIFIASNLKDVIDPFTSPMDIRMYMLLILLPVILINYVRNLKYLAPFSTIGTCLAFISFGITFTYVLRDMPEIEERVSVAPFKGWPLFFGTVLFSLEAIGVILPLENEMKTPHAFGGMCGVFNRAMILLIFIYCLIGFFGYLKYGDETKGSLTLNIPKNEALAQTVKIMISLTIFVSHAIQCYVAIDIVWTGYLSKKISPGNWHIFWEYVVRTCIVLLTFTLAVAIPNIELFISLVGALCVSMLALVFPSVLETCCFWNHKKGCDFVFMCIKNVLIICFGLLGLVIGFSTSVADIVQKLF